MPALLLLTGPSAGLRFEVQTELTVGRSPSCDLPLEDGQVSRRHARLWAADGRLHLADLGSRNGTRVNGAAVAGERVLRAGDRVQVGETTLLVEPPFRAALADPPADVAARRALPAVDALPRSGMAAALLEAGVALGAAPGRAAVLRRAAEEARRVLPADRAVALLGGPQGLVTAAVAGEGMVAVPRDMALAALERAEVTLDASAVCAPLLAAAGRVLGVLYAERRAPPTGEADQQTLAALARLAGAALAGVAERSEAGAGGAGPTLVGSARAFRQALELARRAAEGDGPLQVYGAPGTGRAALARAVHAWSGRAEGPLVEVECRLPPEVVETCLLGPGGPAALLRADGGTLLLRGADHLPPGLASTLAHLLGRGRAPGPDGRGETPVDVRVVATAAGPGGLQWLGVAMGGEAESVEAVGLPPLRERRGDISALFAHFATDAARPSGQPPPGLSPEARRMLVEYAWPHNVRELRLVAERLALLYAGQEVPALHLPPELQEGGAALAPRTLAARIQRLEREAVVEALREANGKKIRAAALLGISRPTLDKKIDEYGLVAEPARRGGGRTAERRLKEGAG